MLAPLARALDRFISRGRGLDARADPFAPPLAEGAVAELLAKIRAAPAADALPFTSPLPPPGGSATVEVRTFGEGEHWALVVPHYGSLASPSRLGVTRALVDALRDEDYAVAIMALPYHASRAFPGRPGGWGFVRADLAATQLAVGSAAAETLALARHLRARGATRLVGVGISLGGSAIGLAAAMGAPFDELALVAAVDNPGAFYATGQNRAARRSTLAANGYDAARTCAAFAPIAPSSFPAPLAPDRMVWAIPPQDGVVPPESQEAWRKAWGGTRLDLGAHGHASALASRSVARRVAAALNDAHG